MTKLAVIFVSLCISLVLAQDEFVDIYCGNMNCYEVLGLPRDTTKKDIGKSYRKLAGKWHPDMFRNEEDKAEAEKKFMQIATAYETLRDEESRTEYDYMLEHPEEMWRNYYRYYRRRVGPKVDVRLVLAVTISLISAAQYYFSWANYNEAIKCLAAVPKYRIQATEIAKAEGLLKKDKKADRGKSKEELKEEEENIIRSVVADKMDVRGGYAKPNYTDILWIQLVLLPYSTVRYIYWYMSWVWRFYIKKEEYGRDEQLHLIRKLMGVSQGQFDNMEEDEVEDMLEKELWKPDNFKEYKTKKDAEMRVKMAESGRYKQYRRYMKNHGGDRMTFDDS
ncbi:dnaJ homolog subfamily C member 25 homolog [Eurytemora carolleeae]|uniref:dnaJ homolog subfamily C member 25 homolog n=1 Tax=Eurytemora carolleeae TaxID=1294199 RepID=UPI000C790986|nr:dnaJ homolog subfamily C member 25 homolog [Eurytemora carolleeae]|eukprot:XP_023326593.1 dnaJ homolog subfamily C member 25 homolog [Eurytemora affinis]